MPAPVRFSYGPMPKAMCISATRYRSRAAYRGAAARRVSPRPACTRQTSTARRRLRNRPPAPSSRAMPRTGRRARHCAALNRKTFDRSQYALARGRHTVGSAAHVAVPLMLGASRLPSLARSQDRALFFARAGFPRRALRADARNIACIAEDAHGAPLQPVRAADTPARTHRPTFASPIRTLPRLRRRPAATGGGVVKPNDFSFRNITGRLKRWGR